MENTKNSTSSNEKMRCLKCGKKEAIQCKGRPLEYKCMNCGTILVCTPQ